MKKLVLIAGWLLLITTGNAQKPGNSAFPSLKEELAQLISFDEGDFKYQVEDYISKPQAYSFQFSPNGKYLSYICVDEKNVSHINIKEIATGKEQWTTIESIYYSWLNDERLFYWRDKGGDENTHLFAVNIDGSNLLDLTPFDGVRASLIDKLKDLKDYIIISMNKNNPQIFEPYKLNVVTGELVQLFENKDPENPIDNFIFDKDGELRGYVRLVDGVERKLYYKDLPTGEFNFVKQTGWEDVFKIIDFNYRSENKDEAYVVTNLDRDKKHVILYDFKNNREIKEVFSNPDYDLNGISFSIKRTYEIDYYAYSGEKRTIVPVSEFYKEIHTRIETEFKEKSFSIVDCTADEKTFLLFVYSDKLCGAYYLYDSQTKQFALLYDLKPQLKEEDMAEMRPITFKSRDGLTIHGYITLPKEVMQGKKAPLIVNPHGGPQGVRDLWGFNAEAQLFASRGYATLNVNFRISAGYGKEFFRAGFKQVGRKVMDDVEDGVKYVIEQGWVEKDKIAIYGVSHGGYAALMGLIRTPDLYTCGVDCCGISNIFTFFDTFPEYWKPQKKMMKEIWYDVDNPEEVEIVKEVSPVYQADKVTKPVFVIQGANDPRVNINESDQIVFQLRTKGFAVPYLVRYNEGHGFYHVENQMYMYKCTLGFFAKNFAGK
jgi:dipeptidyl aminopeptidase/acylaminoacyl peptidase